MIIGSRDLFGFQRLYYHPPGNTWAHSIFELLQTSGAAAEPDLPAIAGYLNGRRLTGRTVLRDVLAVPPGHELIQTEHGLETRASPPQRQPRGDLAAALRASLQQALDSGNRVALALSGGLDSALLLGLLRELHALPRVTAYILVTDIPGYCERAAALEITHQMRARTRLVQVSGHDFVTALPRTVQSVEEPLFNLHPVAKLLLAQAMADNGIELAITGDGADQVLRRDQSANYLPLCHALFDAAAVRLHPPFLDDEVVAHLMSIPPDPDKHCLRELGARLNLPGRLVHEPKLSRLAPAMDLGGLLDQDRLHALAARLGLPAPTLQSDPERVLWTTLSLTLDHLRNKSNAPPGMKP